MIHKLYANYTQAVSLRFHSFPTRGRVWADRAIAGFLLCVLGILPDNLSLT